MDSSHGISSPVHLPLQREGCETEHHQKDCSNAEFLRLTEKENLLQAVFDSIGIKVGELAHPSTMINLFSFSCDLGFLSVTTEDVEFQNSGWISNNFSLSFRDSCMGIIKNEQSIKPKAVSIPEDTTMLCSTFTHAPAWIVKVGCVPVTTHAANSGS